MEKNLLKEKLEKRPSKTELIELNILNNLNVAPSLQQVTTSLQKSIVQDTLKHAINDRPGQEHLLNQNILHYANISPAIQSASDSLEKEKKNDSLRKSILERPNKSELIDQNILQRTNVAPSLQSTKNSLEKCILQDSMKKLTNERPEKEDLINQNILLNTNIAPALQKTAIELEKSLKNDSISKCLLKRQNATAWGSIHLIVDNKELNEHRTTVSEDGKQVHCWIEATEGKTYQIKASTLPFFKASIHVFVDGQWNEGRILSGGLVGILQGRTVGENQTQPFIFSKAKSIDNVESSKDENSYNRAGSITVELWHVEIVGETKPVNWNSLGSQLLVPANMKDSNSLSHTTSFGDKVEDKRVGSSVMITRPIFSEPFLVVTFEYLSKELLLKKGLFQIPESISEPNFSYLNNTLTKDNIGLIGDLTTEDLPSPSTQKIAKSASRKGDGVEPKQKKRKISKLNLNKTLNNDINESLTSTSKLIPVDPSLFSLETAVLPTNFLSHHPDTSRFTMHSANSAE